MTNLINDGFRFTASRMTHTGRTEVVKLEFGKLNGKQPIAGTLRSMHLNTSMEFCIGKSYIGVAKYKNEDNDTYFLVWESHPMYGKQTRKSKVEDIYSSKEAAEWLRDVATKAMPKGKVELSNTHIVFGI